MVFSKKKSTRFMPAPQIVYPEILCISHKTEVSLGEAFQTKKVSLLFGLESFPSNFAYDYFPQLKLLTAMSKHDHWER